MNRAQLEHVIRAAATIAGDDEIVVIGFGDYAQAVGHTTAVLPEGWEARLMPVPTAAGTVLCLESRDYVRAAVRHRLADRATLVERLARTRIPEEQRGTMSRQIEADFAA